MSAIRGPISGSGAPRGINKREPWIFVNITLPMELRNQVRAQVPAGGSLISTIRELLEEALDARAEANEQAASSVRAVP